ncbi:MAG TPA: ATP-dependent 6-phosphofructokinase [Planctomycetota bacterium]|nr:ATP-dependent 6-phosphofructokinase [Planctomycetota bacterium]
MHRIGVLTSGGDAPGMNAAVRAVTRYALDLNWEVVGVKQGFAGLISESFEPFKARSVSNIMQHGGTILGSARSQEFKTPEGRRKAVANLSKHKIDAMVVIGGNGSQTGSLALAEMGVPVAGVASTIDNDLAGTEITIGVDTALNIALEAIDRLKTTASSLQRAFLLEVMGRDCGYLALMAGIAGGAEAIVIPEMETTPEQVARILHDAHKRGKCHAVAVVAEGARYNAEKMVAYFREHKAETGFDLRVTNLGHTQRGGIPTLQDRWLGTRLGAGAVEALARGEKDVLTGINQGRVTTVALKDIVGKHKPLDTDLLRLAHILEK